MSVETALNMIRRAMREGPMPSVTDMSRKIEQAEEAAARVPILPVAILTDNVWFTKQQLKREGCRFLPPTDQSMIGEYSDSTPFRIFKDCDKDRAAHDICGYRFSSVRVVAQKSVSDLVIRAAKAKVA